MEVVIFVDIKTQLVNLWNYVTGPQLWITLGKGFIKILIICILAMIVVKIGKNIINRIFQKRKHNVIKMTERREETLKSLTQNMLAYIVYFMAFVMVLETLGLPIGSLLAGAGVAGLAIGFGAQNLVRDVISGFFIVFEDQFSIGDYVEVSGAEGTVDRKSTRLNSSHVAISYAVFCL